MTVMADVIDAVKSVLTSIKISRLIIWRILRIEIKEASAIHRSVEKLGHFNLCECDLRYAYHPILCGDCVKKFSFIEYFFVFDEHLIHDSILEDEMVCSIFIHLFPEEGTDEYQLLSIENFLPHPVGVKYIVNPVNEDIILGTEGQNGGQMNYSRFGQPEP